jgi:transposase-like protein
MLARPEETISSIARLLGVSCATLYKYVPELTTAARPADQHLQPGLPVTTAQPGAARTARHNLDRKR